MKTKAWGAVVMVAMVEILIFPTLIHAETTMARGAPMCISQSSLIEILKAKKAGHSLSSMFASGECVYTSYKARIRVLEEQFSIRWLRKGPEFFPVKIRIIDSRFKSLLTIRYVNSPAIFGDINGKPYEKIYTEKLKAWALQRGIK